MFSGGAAGVEVVTIFAIATQDSVQRGAKIAADLFCVMILAAFSVAHFGILGGTIALVILSCAVGRRLSRTGRGRCVRGSGEVKSHSVNGLYPCI